MTFMEFLHISGLDIVSVGFLIATVAYAIYEFVAYAIYEFVVFLRRHRKRKC